MFLNFFNILPLVHLNRTRPSFFSFSPSSLVDNILFWCLITPFSKYRTIAILSYFTARFAFLFFSCLITSFNLPECERCATELLYVLKSSVMFCLKLYRPPWCRRNKKQISNWSLVGYLKRVQFYNWFFTHWICCWFCPVVYERNKSEILGRFPSVRSDQPVLKWNTRVFRTGSLLMDHSRSVLVLPLRSAIVREFGELWREQWTRALEVFIFKNWPEPALSFRKNLQKESDLGLAP